MPTELGSAYLTLMPSLRGAKSSINQQLSAIDVEPAARTIGAKMTAGISKQFGALGTTIGQKVVEGVTGVDISSLKGFAESMLSIATHGASEGFGLKGVGGVLDTLGTKAKSFGQTLTTHVTQPALKAAGTIAGIGTAATAAGVAVGGIFVAKGWNRLVQIDSAKKKLEGLGHSAEEVELIMNNANNAVLGTAFSLGEAATVAASAVAAGIKPGQQLENVLKTIGDTATIAGRDFASTGAIFNSVMARGKLQGDDMLQLTSAGVPVLQALAQHLGTTQEAVSEMVTNGKIDFQTFADAMQEYLGGSALKSGEMITGAMANVWAAVGRVGEAFLDAGGKGNGFFTQIIPLLGELKDNISGMKDTAAEWGVVFGDAFKISIDRGKELIDLLLPENFNLKPTQETAQAIFDIVNGAFDIIDTVVVKGKELVDIFLPENFKIGDIGGIAQDACGLVSGAFDLAIDAAKLLKGAWDTLPKPMQDFLVKAALLAPALGPFLEAGGSVVSVAGRIVGGLGEIIGISAKVVTAFKILAVVKGTIGSIKDEMGKLVSAGSNMVGAFSDIASGISESMTGAQTVVSGIGDTAKNVMTGVSDTAKTAFNGIKESASNIKDVGKSAFEGFKQGEGILGKIKGAASGAAAGISGLKDKTGQFAQTASTAKTAVEGVKTSAQNVGSGFEKSKSAVDHFKSAAEKAKQAASQVGSVGSDAGNAVKGAWSGVKSVINGAVEGFKNGKGAIGSIKGAIQGTVQSMGQLVSSSESVKSALVGIGVTAAAMLTFATVQTAIDKFNEAKEKAETFKLATEGLVTAANGAELAVGGEANALRDFSSNAGSALPSVDELIQRQADLAKSIQESNYAHAGEIRQLQEAGETISALINKHDEYGNRVQLTESEQAQLKQAIATVNDECGTQYEVIDAVNGVIQDEKGQILDTCDAIDQYILKKQAMIKIDQWASEQAKIEEQRSIDQEKYNGLLERESQIRQDMANYAGSHDDWAYKSMEGELENIRGQLNQTKGALDGASQAYDEYNQKIARAAEVAQGSASSWDAVVLGVNNLSDAFKGNDFSIDDFANKLESAGVSADTFADISFDDAWKFREAYSGSLTSVAGLLAQHGVDLNNAATQAQLSFEAMSTDADFMSQKVSDAFNGVSFSRDDFVKGIEGAGVSVTDFATLNDDQLAQVVTAYGEDLGAAVGKIHEFVDANKTSGSDAGKGLAEGLAEGVVGCGDLVYAAANTEIATAFAQFSGNPEFATTGGFITQGIAQGMLEDSSLTDAAGPLSESAIEALRAAFGAHSPATTTIPIGHDLNEGIAQGMIESTAATEASTALSQNILSSLLNAFSQSSSIATSIGTQIGNSVAFGMMGTTGVITGSALAMSNAAITGIQPTIEQATRIGTESGAGFAQGILSKTGESVSASKANVDAVIETLNTAKRPAQEVGRATGSNFAVGVWDKMGEASRAGSDVKSSAISAMSGGYDSAYSKGASIAQGFVDGILSKKSSASSAAAEVKAAGTIAAALDKPLFDVPFAAPETLIERSNTAIAPIAEGIVPMASPILTSVQSATSELTDAAMSGLAVNAIPGRSASRMDDFSLEQIHSTVYNAVYAAIKAAMPKETNLFIDGNKVASTIERDMDARLESIRARRSR